MRHREKTYGPRTHLLFLLLGLTACSSAPSPKFYTLNPSVNKSIAVSTQKNTASYSVAVGPVTLPAIVDRTQIVLNSGPNRVTISEQSRWAEPLKENIPRVIAGDLAQLLGNDRVFAHPQAFVSDPDYRVLANIYRFDSIHGDAAVIDLQWIIRSKNNGAQIGGRTIRRETANGNDFDSLVAAHERALAEVSREIAAAIEQIRTRP
jgi:uncharacterized protein